METCQLSGAARAFEVFCWAKGLSPRTVKTYGDGLRKLTDFLIGTHGHDPTLPTRAELRSFIVHLADSGLSRASVAIHVRSLKAFFSYLSQDGYLRDNPMDGIPIPKTGRSAPVALAQPDVRGLLAAARGPSWFDIRNTAMLMTFLDTGMRLAELISLDLEDVNLPEWRIRIRNGKGSKERIVFVGRGLHRILRRWLQVRGPLHESSALFITRSGHRHDSRNVERIIERIAKKAGLNGTRVTPHIFRHTFAVNYVRNGGDAFSLRRLLGHSDIRTTEIYVDMVGEDLRKAHAKASPLDRLLTPYPGQL